MQIKEVSFSFRSSEKQCESAGPTEAVKHKG